MHIPFGLFNRQITIEHKSVTPDPDYGTETITWLPFAARIAASYDESLPSKSESISQGIRVAHQPATIQFRYRPGVTSDMRIVLHGDVNRLFQITGGPALLGRKEWLEVSVEEYSV